MAEEIKTMFDEPADGEQKPENSVIGSKVEEASE
jgi:hypothetical protein